MTKMHNRSLRLFYSGNCATQVSEVDFSLLTLLMYVHFK